MDQPTIDFYNAHAAERAKRYAEAPSRVGELIPFAFPTGARVLDIGTGSGRDLNALLEAGYPAAGVDPSSELIRQAEARFPAVAGRITVDHLPELQTVPNESIDGVLCVAVLMHVREQLLLECVLNLRRILRLGGRILISTPLTAPEVNAVTHRDPLGRLFNGVTPERFQFLFEKAGFRRVERWDTEDALGRKERHWSTQLFVLEAVRS